MNQGISVEEACSIHAVGTEQDYERLCNQHGPSTYLVISIAAVVIIVVVAVGLFVRKQRKIKLSKR